jgi:threonine dehydratase
VLTLDHIRQAADLLHPAALRTPLLTSPGLDAAVGQPVLCKAECLQRGGSFKFRGAYHRLRRLPPAARAGGVIAASSGNHAAALALAAQILATHATVVLPADAPASKAAAARRRGATIVVYDRHRDDRDTIVADLAAAHGLTVVPSADHPDVIAGNATVALEILADTNHIDTLLVPIGGGGLAAGCATVVKALTPATRVIGVEPAAGDDTARSLRAGTRQTIPTPTTIADGLRHTTPAQLPFSIMQRLLDDVLTVSDTDITAAVTLAFTHLKTVIEPTGAAALAAASQIHPRRGKIAVVLSGGNADWTTLHPMLADPRPAA